MKAFFNKIPALFHRHHHLYDLFSNLELVFLPGRPAAHPKGKDLNTQYLFRDLLILTLEPTCPPSYCPAPPSISLQLSPQLQGQSHSSKTRSSPATRFPFPS